MSLIAHEPLFPRIEMSQELYVMELVVRQARAGEAALVEAEAALSREGLVRVAEKTARGTESQKEQAHRLLNTMLCDEKHTQQYGHGASARRLASR